MITSGPVMAGTPGSRMRLLLACLLLPILIFAGCRPEADREPAARDTTVTGVRFMGQQLETFATADAQLAWVLSLQGEPTRRTAGLHYILDHFPDDRRVCGRAALEIAYLALGPDHRLASPSRCREALALLDGVLHRYGDLPAVAARGLWYKGWLLTDLLHEDASGLGLLHELVNRFPDTPMDRPRFVFHYRPAIPVQRGADHLLIDTSVRWADLALLFIVERTRDGQQRQAALEQLLQRGPCPRIAGLAILHCLKHPPVSNKLLDIAHRYLDRPQADKFLRRDIGRRLRHMEERGTGAEKRS